MPIPGAGVLGGSGISTLDYQAAIEDFRDWVAYFLTVTEGPSYRVSFNFGDAPTSPGNYTIRMGLDAAQSDQGADGIAMGRLAAPHGQGVGSIAIGALSGSSDDTGESFQPAYCVAIGRGALTADGGDGVLGYNTAVGSSAVIEGFGIQYSSNYGASTYTTESYASLFGAQATAGYRGSAFGFSANAPAANTTAMGADAGPTADTYEGWTCLGASANVITADNQIQLGASGTTTYAYGAVQNRSDARDKADIRDTELGLDFINALRPVQFRWDLREDYRAKEDRGIAVNSKDTPKRNKKRNAVKAQPLSTIAKDGSKKRSRFHNGLIAQEVAAVCDSLGVDFAGLQHHQVGGGDDVYSIGYEELIAPLIKAVQQLSARVVELEARDSHVVGQC